MTVSGGTTTLAQRVVVVTGATSGIGQAVAEALAPEVAGLVCFGRRADAAPTGHNILAVSGDINSAQDVNALFEQTMERFGRLDALVNSAGINVRGKFLDLSHDDWSRAINTNLIGYALACRAVLPIMKEQAYGRIVNLGTRLAWECAVSSSAYSCSKAGASMLTRCLASEIDRNRYPDILVNDLIPGPTKTAMNAGGQPPQAVVPFVRQLLLLPKGGVSGATFFRGKKYPAEKISFAAKLFDHVMRR